MDFWSRIVRGSTPQKKKSPNLNSPQLRQVQFKRAYNNLLQIWHNGDIESTDVFAAENVRLCVRRLSELLVADQRGPTPHLCVAFAATSRLLVTIARVSTAFNSDVITHEALSFCSLLIDSEEEAFLEDRGFADTLPDFIESIQRTVRHTRDNEIESSMVEMLFGIAAKLRIEPHVLRVWFRPEKPEEDDEDLSDSERRTRFEEFPLFYLLLHYVPSEGRSGEFARMGLLYIIETTAHSEDLERWIVDGDMSALMASGLGALYSQLGRKLALSYHKDEVPSILTYSARIEKDPALDAELTTSVEYQRHLTTFLASLVFWQDLLEHCASIDVKQTLLDHFQYLFLQQLLYPSLLESSDVDGGSAVAVLTYLRHILESIDHPDLVRLTMRYLFGKENKPMESRSSTRPISKIRRRKSAHLMARLAEEEQFSPDLFNLTDLICSSLKSTSQQTITATLYLLSAMLRRSHHQSLTGLLRTRPLRLEAERRTIGGQEKEVDNLLTLAESLTAFQNLEMSYEKNLHDNRNVLESHPCSSELLRLQNVSIQDLSTQSSLRLERRILMTDDPILKGIIALLDRFFQNDIETNLGLTQVIIDLASCGFLSLEGWLLTHPSKYRFAEGDEDASQSIERPSLPSDEEAEIHRINLSRREPAWNMEDASPLYRTLSILSLEIGAWQREIADFDELLLDCRTTIEGPDADIGSAGEVESLIAPLESGRNSPSKQHNVPLVGSIAQRLKSGRAYSRDVSIGSTRGRALEESPASEFTGRMTHLQMSPSRSPPENNLRHHSPSPLRGRENLSSTPPLPPPQLAAKAPRKALDTLKRLVKISNGDTRQSEECNEQASSETSSLLSEIEPERHSLGPEKIPLGQLMTNIIVLQEFILEMAALIEVRASLFGEVKYL